MAGLTSYGEEQPLLSSLFMASWWLRSNLARSTSALTAWASVATVAETRVGSPAQGTYLGEGCLCCRCLGTAEIKAVP